MNKITLLYISLSGNTLSFVNRLSEYLLTTYDTKTRLINIKDLDHQTFPLTEHYITIVPTYLEGGNGVDNGDKEILTTPLREFIKEYDNYNYCLGVIGSGNKNFNNQYCLTAKQYSQQFNIPVIDNFEMRGTNEDIQRIGDKIEQIINNIP